MDLVLLERIKLDTVVVGGGVVGLACARALSGAGCQVSLIESADRCGDGVSSRNSEVIHAGIYYPPGSRKALHCIRGRKRLYAYLEERDLPYHRAGKLIVATSTEDVARLMDIKANAESVGVEGLEIVAPDWLKRNEPAVKAEAALLSPFSGWVDSTALIQALEADVQRMGGQIFVRSKVIRLCKISNGFELGLEDEDAVLNCRRVILSAGLGTDELLERCFFGLREHIPAQIWARGSYFALQGKAPFRRHIYPLPAKGGLGVHATLDVLGGIKFGPDVEWLDTKEDIAQLFNVDAARKAGFVEAVGRFWPGVENANLIPAFAGVRPKLTDSRDGFADFGIYGPAAHNIDGLIVLTGIESPGLTSALSIADEVVELLDIQ